MKCPVCKIVEMVVDNIEDETVTHKCKKCGQIFKEPIPKEVISIESE